MKNKNALKYEMTDWKQLQIQKQNTKEVISVQKTKLRQELKRQRIGQKRFRKIVCVVIAVLAVLYIQLITELFLRNLKLSIFVFQMCICGSAHSLFLYAG